MYCMIPEEPVKALLENDNTLALDGAPAGTPPKVHAPQLRDAKGFVLICSGLRGGFVY